MTNPERVYAGECVICSAYCVAYASQSRPVKIGTSPEFMAEVARRRYCGAPWEIGAFSRPQVISREHARRELPDLSELERALGIAFPDPSAV